MIIDNIIDSIVAAVRQSPAATLFQPLLSSHGAVTVLHSVGPITIACSKRCNLVHNGHKAGMCSVIKIFSPSLSPPWYPLATEDFLEIPAEALVVRPRMQPVFFVHLYCRTICSNELQVHGQEACQAKSEGEGEDAHNEHEWGAAEKEAMGAVRSREVWPNVEELKSLREQHTSKVVFAMTFLINPRAKRAKTAHLGPFNRLLKKSIMFFSSSRNVRAQPDNA
jgi:hypothetical protein